MNDLFHPLADLFPLIEGAEFDALVVDIAAHGIREKIIILDGLILDGRNRFRAGVAAGLLSPELPALGDAPFIRHFERYFPRGDGDPLAFVISKNLQRRHLNESQRAYVAARIANLSQGRQPADKAANLPVKQEDAARLLNVSERSVRDAALVREQGTDDLNSAVERGFMPVSLAAKAARLTPETQSRIAENAVAGKANVVRTAVKQQARAAREVSLAVKQKALPDKKYGVIYADPEWRFETFSRETGLDRAADNHYPTSILDEIKARDVPSIAADDCVLFLWTTVPMLEAALQVLNFWTFDYRSNFNWHKDRIGTGYWNRNRHEHLLIGTRGHVPAPALGTQFDSSIEAALGNHSAKPEIFYEIIETYFPNLPKIELNRRGAPRPGWDAWGYEAELTP